MLGYAPRRSHPGRKARPVARVSTFQYRRHRLTYEVHGEGPKVFVFVHGLLLDAALNRHIGRMLAERGHKVVLLELLGHGRSDKPTHAYEHRLEFFAEQVIALLDHLEIDEAVVGGVSLGANVSLQVAATAPDRLRGIVAEMPVLERGTIAAAIQFAPLLLAFRYAAPVVRIGTRLMRSLPRTRFDPLNSFLNLLSADPREMAAVLHGLFVGPGTPAARVRREIEVPALVVGHPHDLLHALDDADALAAELPNSRFVRARSLFEARSRPARIVGEISDFLDEVWAPTLAAAREA